MNPFAIMLGFGCVFGLVSWARQSIKQPVSEAFLVLGLALLGARTAFVLIRWPYFSHNLLEAFQFSAGGLDGPAAFLGALTGLILIAIGTQRSLFIIIKGFLPLLIPLVVSVWLGCWLEGVAYGRPLTVNGLAWLDWHSPQTPYWPLPLFVVIFLLFYFFGLDRLQHQKFNDGLVILYPLGVIVSLLAISLFRQDEPAPYWNNIRVDVLETGFLFIYTLLVWTVVMFLKGKRYEAQRSVSST